jgi:hypothetical protein
MKNKKLQLLAALLITAVPIIFNGCACKKQILGPDGLPPITDTGTNTFGCMVNGKPFIPGGNSWWSGQNPLKCAYQYFDNGYHLALSGSYKETNTILGVSIACDSVTLVKGQSYILKLDSIGNAFAGYHYYAYTNQGNSIMDEYHTKNFTNLTGELTITNLDDTKQILSGTFWFNAVNQNAPYDTVKVTEGRFDVHFTR